MADDGPTAVVIGASLAGLLAARVLADHYPRVILVERDALPDGPVYRRGVPQARHLHLLLARGEQILTGLLPGLAAELDEAGATRLDLGLDVLTIIRGRPLPAFASGVYGRPVSRLALEGMVRRRVLARPGIDCRPLTVVTGLQLEAGRVIGVRLGYRGGATGPAALAADLVVDASGRRSRTPDWLAELGFGAPPVSRVNAFLGYATRPYRPPPGAPPPWRLFLVATDPPHQTRGGAIMLLEDGRWLVTLAGTAYDYPPTDEPGFLQFARDADERFYQAIVQAQPVGDIAGYRRTENVWRHYERLAEWPERLLVVGDAVCAFNPVYGQGMTACALDALELDRLLREVGPDGAGLGRRFQRRIATAVKRPIWFLATNEDFRWPTTAGRRAGLATRISHWYVEQVLQTIPYSTTVTRSFLEVQQLLQPGSRLLRPGIVARVLGRRWLRRRAEADGR